VAFKTSKGVAGVPESPELLFNDLRGRKVPALLAHQADVLREYTSKYVTTLDVAIQLPTGSGKTLVGLLVAEWRRRKYAERAVYLCPTNQLVYQVAEQAESKYGLHVIPLTGKKSAYDAKQASDYQLGEAVAITSYPSLFNVRPFFSDPHLIVLDDAHSADGAVSSLWTMLIERTNSDHASLFKAIVSTLKPVLTKTDYQRLCGAPDTTWGRTWVEKVPTPKLVDLIPELVSVIDAHVENTGLSYSWRLMRDNLAACHFYLGVQEVLIRPLLAPTRLHQPFWNAKQRIYMSATLGESGELERLFGKKSISRIKVPPGWDRHGIGRRLFFFPGRSLNEKETSNLLFQMFKRAKKALVLVPDDRSAGELRKRIDTALGWPVFDAKAIEQSKKEFNDAPRAVAVIANRYDGIDFPEDECRLLVIFGLPRATNLQERFLVARMGAVALLNERILTRVVQAFGRCTRTPTDYSAVVVIGDELNKFLFDTDRRKYVHPELQAELQFGIDQAKGLSVPGALENFDLFLKQDTQWKEADNEIVLLRDRLEMAPLPGADELRNAVEHEVEYEYAMWRGDFAGAVSNCKQVLGALKARQLQGYQALWHYIAGSAAWLRMLNGDRPMETVARKHFSAALQNASLIQWLASLASYREPVKESYPKKFEANLLIERIEAVLEGLGTLHDQKFTAEEKAIRDGVGSSDADMFEAGHQRLGRLLGYDAGNSKSVGAPDPWWVAHPKICFVFEDYSDSDETGSVAVKKARQAATHPKWIRANVEMNSDAEIVPVLITAAKRADKDAIPILEDVLVWDIRDFRKWAEEALSTIRELARDFPGSGDLAWRSVAEAKLIEARIAPEKLREHLKGLPKLPA